jgi:metal-dependent amidase/aminoacylase/carboxypeptidase family protein
MSTCAIPADNPELGFKEFKAHKLLTTYLSSKGFTVTSWPTLETAFVATFEHGQGGRTMGFNAEYDALPGIGHACGHSASSFFLLVLLLG